MNLEGDKGENCIRATRRNIPEDAILHLWGCVSFCDPLRTNLLSNFVCTRKFTKKALASRIYVQTNFTSQ
jgi:hypothetical protein